MKNNSARRGLYRTMVGVAGMAVVVLGSSCATTYDAYGGGYGGYGGTCYY